MRSLKDRYRMISDIEQEIGSWACFRETRTPSRVIQAPFSNTRALGKLPDLDYKTTRGFQRGVDYRIESKRRLHVSTYMGDSRGRWEGNTLVVETTNIIPNTTGFGGTTMSDAARLVERFTRVDTDTLNYEITVHDLKTYTKPFTVAVPIRQEPGYQLFEYGCHEGNRGMMNQLSGSRADETAAEAATQKQQ